MGRFPQILMKPSLLDELPVPVSLGVWCDVGMEYASSLNLFCSTFRTSISLISGQTAISLGGYHFNKLAHSAGAGVESGQR